MCKWQFGRKTCKDFMGYEKSKRFINYSHLGHAFHTEIGSCSAY